MEDLEGEAENERAYDRFLAENVEAMIDPLTARILNARWNRNRIVRQLGEDFTNAAVVCASVAICNHLLGPDWDFDTDMDMDVGQIIDAVVLGRRK